MMHCTKHDREMRMIRCPDGRPGCAVAHFACDLCRKERAALDVLEALQIGSGVEPGPVGTDDRSKAE